MPEFLAASLLSSAEYSYRKISEYSNGLEFPQIANTRIRKCNSSSSFIFSAVVAVHTDNIIAFPSTLIFPVWSICGNILFYLRWGTTYVLKVFLKLLFRLMGWNLDCYGQEIHYITKSSFLSTRAWNFCSQVATFSLVSFMSSVISFIFPPPLFSIQSPLLILKSK